MFKRIITPLSPAFVGISLAFNILALLAIGCNKSAKSTAATETKKEVSEEEAYKSFKSKGTDGKTFGEKVDAKGAVSYDAVLPKLKKLNGADKLENVKVTGTVNAVCQSKGCWMNIASEKGETPMLVKFKDYAFFMPKDLAGKKVVMQGYAFKEVTDVPTLRHFAEDAGKSKEDIAKITLPKEEYKFMANGVLILE
jgi:Domain of unknown function (DUF4920)